MADNTQLNVGTGGDVIKTEDVGGYKLAVSKIYLGAHGIDGGAVTATNPLPVSVGNLPAIQPISGAVSISGTAAADTTDRAGRLLGSATVSGTVAVSNFPSSQPVTGTLSANQGTPAALAGAWPTMITDGAHAASVFQAHNADNQSQGGAFYAINTGGVAQLLNSVGNLDRQRGTGLDGIPAQGIASGSNQLASPVTTTVAANISTGVQTVTPASMAGIFVGSCLRVANPGGSNAETIYVSAVASTTFTAAFAQTKTGPGITVNGFQYNQQRDATGGDGLSAVGISAENPMLMNGSGTFDRERNASGDAFGTALADGRTPGDRGTEAEVSYLYAYNGTAFNRLRLDASNNLQVGGTVSVGNFPATQAVSVGNFPATQAVSGVVTATQGGAPWSQNVTQVGGASLTLGQKPMAASVPVALASDQATLGTNATLQPGTNLAGVMIAPTQTGTMYSGTTAVTPQFAAISSSTAGDNTLVAAVAGKTIRVLKYTVMASSAVAVKFGDGIGTNPITGAMPVAANSGIGGAYCPIGHFQTSAGNALVMNLSTAVPVAGHLTYILV
jgi:hypothetical protein